MSLAGLDDRSVDQILEVIDAEMPAPKQPKVVLFDIGGVCVLSPFQAILDYELGLGIPPGWVNFSISKAAPNGAWHKLERGEVKANKEGFFDGFNKDLHNSALWTEFYKREQAKNPKLPKEVPQLPAVDGEWLFNAMISFATATDPWMFPALEKLKSSGKYIIGALSNTIVVEPGHPLHLEDYFNDPFKKSFDVFISSAHIGIRKPDPRMYQEAVKTLDKYARENSSDPKRQGLGWETGVKAEDILFLDDIGENLKEARKQGFNTIRVPLGKAYEAVEELENATGLQLAGSHPKIAVKPNLRGSKAKI